MLVFRRQKGDSFMIGEDVEVRILQIGRGYVKIGVIAPREIEVFRTEISKLNREARLKDWSDPQVEKGLRDVLGFLRSEAGDEDSS